MDKREDTRNVADEIEESLRICEEILNNNPDFEKIEIPEMPEEPPVVLKKEVPKEEPAVEVEEEAKVKVEPMEEPVAEPEVKVEPKEEPVAEPEKTAEPLVLEKVEQEERAENEKPEKSGLAGTLIRFGSCIAIAFVVAFLITRFVANHTTVEGNSMNPCLQDGDDLVVEKLSYLTGEIERFDIIVFEQSEDVNYIKRVIGLPGETIQIKDEKIYINGCALFDEYRKEKMKDAGIAKDEIVLGSDEYFVLGDNRNASKDSRDEEVGAVKKEQIRGKAWLRVLPSENFGIIK